jgi:tripartite-type tricarboxylate transporter receptor subunit TctC
MMGAKVFPSAIVAVVLGLAGTHPADAQSYPDRLIKIVVPYPPGGPGDVAARLVAQPLSSEGLNSPEMRASIAKLGMEARSMTAREFAAQLADEARLWEAAVNESGVKMD